MHFKAMEFAFCSEEIRDRKPRELMTPSMQEGVFYVQLHFGDAGRRAWNWSSILRVWLHW